jgi:hypothetical protein
MKMGMYTSERREGHKGNKKKARKAVRDEATVTC